MLFVDCCSAVPVHPRACGVRQDRRKALRTACGASPRLRGSECIVCPTTTNKRCIPAPAGFGKEMDLQPPSGAVHSRACGVRQAALGGGL